MPSSLESSFSEGGWKGEASSEARPHLPALLRILDADSPSWIFKEGGSRKVWSAMSPLGEIVVKDYFSVRIFDRILRRLRGSRARLEWIRLKRFEEGGIPVPKPLLWAEGTSASGVVRSVVVTRFVEGSQTLDEFLRLAPPDPSRWKTAVRAGETLAGMHALGALHHDLHAGNLLVSDDGAGRPMVWIMDLHQVVLHRRISWNSRLKNLASLYSGLRDSLTLREKHHALRGYLKSLSDWNPPFRTEREARTSMGRALETFGKKIFRRRCRKRIQKCEENGKRFRSISPGDYRGWVRSDLHSSELLERLADPAGWIASKDCRILKDTPTTTVAQAVYSESRPPLFLKRYNRKDVWERAKNFFRPSRALMVWRAGYGLEVMGIPTPRIAAVLEKRLGPIRLESYILTDWTEEGVGLDDFWNARCSPTSSEPIPRADRRKLRRAVARLFANLHDLRISHGDLKGRNILLDPRAPSPFAPKFVDLDALRMRPIRFRRSRINDLSRLLFSVHGHVTPLTCLRFFREYCGEDRELWNERRDWWRRITKRTHRKLREKGLLPG